MLNPIELDLSEVVDGIVPGEYHVNVTDAQQKVSKSGNPYIRWQLSVFNCTEAKYNGQCVWHSTPTTGKGAFRLVQLYKAAMGQKLDSAQRSLDPQQILGKQLTVVVVQSTDQEGNPSDFTEVKSVRPYKA